MTSLIRNLSQHAVFAVVRALLIWAITCPSRCAQPFYTVVFNYGVPRCSFDHTVVDIRCCVEIRQTALLEQRGVGRCDPRGARLRVRLLRLQNSGEILFAQVSPGLPAVDFEAEQSYALKLSVCVGPI